MQREYFPFSCAITNFKQILAVIDPVTQFPVLFIINVFKYSEIWEKSSNIFGQKKKNPMPPQSYTNATRKYTNIQMNCHGNE